MMTNAAQPEERRRFPRTAPAHDARMYVSVVHDVEVVDIGLSGLLFSSRTSLHVGQRAQIRALLGREPFTASIEVVRVDPKGLAGRTENRPIIGARFVALDDNSQRNLQGFLMLAR